jgi:NTE family protein
MKLSRLYGFARNSEPQVALALQGGGAHGAFTWGVLDHLLEQGRFKVTALSGTSAGALNALALAQGLLDDGPEGARAALQRLWTAVGAQVPFDLLSNGNAEQPILAPGTRALMQWAQWFSPYQFNPLGLNPLRGLLAEQIDFDRLRSPIAPRLFIAATHANSGRLRLFTNAELSVDVALASACLPTLQPAVLI